MRTTTTSLREGHVIDKTEAVAVLRELGQIHAEIASAEIVSVNKSSDTDEFELKIKCDLDAQCRNSINEFLQKRNSKSI